SLTRHVVMIIFSNTRGSLGESLVFLLNCKFGRDVNFEQDANLLLDATISSDYSFFQKYI
ncbi:MAG: hypothetical protein MHMPM18_004327, partial [Marteilia pararefringens]